MGHRKSGLICGVGENDSNSPVVEYFTVNGKVTQKMCPYYRTWKSMLRRCYDLNYERKTYKDCSVCEEWHLFSNFKAWMEKQNYQGLHLDKDVLVKGNKVYSPDTCVFIPNEINAQARFNTKNNPLGFLGVTTENRGKTVKYRSKLVNKDTGGYTYSTAVEAHRAWQWARALQIEQLVTWYSSKNYFRTDVAEALMIKVWKLRIDHNLSIITEEV